MKNIWKDDRKTVRQVRTTAIILCLFCISLFGMIFQPMAEAFFFDRDIIINPGEGISFDQIDFDLPPDPESNSSRGQVHIDYANLKEATGREKGVINIFTDGGWVVQNLPILDKFPYPTVSGQFDLGVASGTDVDKLDALVVFSIQPRHFKSKAPAGSFTSFTVGQVIINATGAGLNDPPAGAQLKPQLLPLLPVLLDFRCVQTNHQGIEAAFNQCYPESVANSLQWLENNYGIDVPHDHVPGVDGDTSLVGQLDSTMARTVGSGTCLGQGMEGKLEYLSNNDLDNLVVKHQADGFFCGDLDGGNFTRHGITSQGNGAPTAAFIFNQVCHGEDVEICWSWAGGGGHCVNLVAIGSTASVSWIMFLSDMNQSDDTAGVGVYYTRFFDTNDADSLPNVVDQDPVDGNVHLVLTESPRKLWWPVHHWK